MAQIYNYMSQMVQRRRNGNFMMSNLNYKKLYIIKKVTFNKTVYRLIIVLRLVIFSY